MKTNKLIKLIIFASIALMATAICVDAAIIIDHNCTDISLIPDAQIQNAKSQLHVVYQHTSHGSQLISGMNALAEFPDFGELYAWDDSGQQDSALDLDDYAIEAVADLSQGDSIDANGVTPWVTATRELLDDPDNTHVNVVIWSWCSIDGHDIERYLENMEILISEYGEGGTNSRAAQYPVQFVFMTGHAEGQGEGGYIYEANEKIRAHCLEKDRILYDFADIESYDPDGDYYYDLPMWDNLDYGDGSSNWAENWIGNNVGSELELLTTGSGLDGYSGVSECAHSDVPAEAMLNCVLKGRAAWWLMAQLSGWDAPDDVVTPSTSTGSGGGSSGCFIESILGP